jgi:hypothetical protein
VNGWKKQDQFGQEVWMAECDGTTGHLARLLLALPADTKTDVDRPYSYGDVVSDMYYSPEKKSVSL